MRNSNIFGFVSKFKSMQPLAKRHRRMNLRKCVLDPRKGKTYIPEALVRVFFLNNIITSSHYALPSGSRADLHNESWRAGSCLGTYFDVSKTTFTSSFLKVWTKTIISASKWWKIVKVQIWPQKGYRSF